MNNVALYFASGESLYPGAALLLSAIAISPFLRTDWCRRARNIVCWLALCLMVIASVPLSPMLAALFLFSFLVWMVAINKPVQNRSTRALGIFTSICVAVFTLSIVSIELSHRKMPVISGASSDHLVVIGDSISAGLDPAVPAWPKVFQQTTGIPVKNLALPGAQVSEGPFMAAKVTSEDRVIVIELGGNDLLSNVPAERFERILNATLAQLASTDRTLVMFELPLLPHKAGYGEIQRRLALQYHIWLIPKRKFIEVLGAANATSDGIHLAPEGTRRMTALIVQVLGPILRARTSSVWKFESGRPDNFFLPFDQLNSFGFRELPARSGPI